MVLTRAREFLRGPRVHPGLYSYRRKSGEKGLSLQLRVEPNGHGVLAINANTVLFLNDTATAHAYLLMKGLTPEEATRALTRMYKVSREHARRDHEQLVYTVNTLAKTEKICPVSYLGVDRMEPFSKTSSAPLRMDLALTFRCENDCLHCYTGGPREMQELTTADWVRVMQKIKDAAIFIVTFTGGEPTMREDLPQLVRKAEEVGLVSGLVTNGRRLRDMHYVQSLSNAGLDFAQITLESFSSDVHDKMTCTPGSWVQTVQGIKNVLDSQIYLSTNTTLTSLNVDQAVETMEFVGELGVRNFSCNSLIYSGRGIPSNEKLSLPLERVKETLSALKQRAEELGIIFNWFTPTRYCELNPVNMGLGIKSCSAGLMNMCVGPSGDVYPCQSYFEPVGNILRDSWDAIWNHPLCVKLRNRKYAPEGCSDCPELHVCGGGCPLERKEKQYVCQQS